MNKFWMSSFLIVLLFFWRNTLSQWAMAVRFDSVCHLCLLNIRNLDMFLLPCAHLVTVCVSGPTWKWMWKSTKTPNSSIWLPKLAASAWEAQPEEQLKCLQGTSLAAAPAQHHPAATTTTALSPLQPQQVWPPMQSYSVDVYNQGWVYECFFYKHTTNVCSNKLCSVLIL